MRTPTDCRNVNGLGADERAARGEEDAHRAGEGGADGESAELELVGRDAHGLGREFVLADSRPGPADLGVLQPRRHDDDDHDHGQGDEVEHDVVELVARHLVPDMRLE